MMIFKYSLIFYFGQILGQILGHMLEITAAVPAIAPITIISIYLSPSFIDIIYHDILSLSLFIYLR